MDALTGSGGDYVLSPEAPSAWVKVGSVSVWIRRTDAGVVVELYPYGVEASVDPLDRCSCSEREARLVAGEASQS